MAAPNAASVTGAGESEDDGLTPRQREDPRFAQAKRAGQGERGREMLEHAAMGAELSDEEEFSALDWLLGTPKPIVHDIPVEVETPRGMRTLTFIAGRIDPRRIDQIELRNVQQSTGRVDRIQADAEIVGEVCDALTDSSGRRQGLRDPRFLTVRLRNRETGEEEDVLMASPAEALLRRFVGQEGVLTLLSAEIRRLAGYDPQRIGQSQRRLVEASLG